MKLACTFSDSGREDCGRSSLHADRSHHAFAAAQEPCWTLQDDRWSPDEKDTRTVSNHVKTA